VPKRGSEAYDTSKAALSHLVRELAMALAPHVRVNATAPATVLAGSAMFPRERVTQSLEKYGIAFSPAETTDALRAKLAEFYAQRTLTKRPIQPQLFTARIRTLRCLCLMACVTLPLLSLGARMRPALAQANTEAALRADFQDPPPDCRIMVRWWWFGPAVSMPELERELRTMKQAGIGGVEIQPVYPLALDDPASGFHNSPYLSDEFINDLRFASDTARALGLRFDVTLGSGWPFGGPHIPVTQAAGKLRVVQVSILSGSDSTAVPAITTGEKLLAAFLSGSAPSFSASQVNLSDIRDGRLILTPAPSPRTVTWFIASRTGMTVKRPAIGAEGFVLDHFDRAAIENHLHSVGERLLAAFGKTPPYAFFSDSLEVYGSDWTGDLLEQFRNRRGYDLTPYLPALVQDIGPETSDVRHDWGQTLTELINERYLVPIREWTARHGTRFRSQTYGIPAVSLSSNALVDLPEGESDHWSSFSPARWASSANHLYKNDVTSAETWTWLHSPAFRATPLDIKADADLFFLQGVNQIVGHGWPYSPERIPGPGWSFYAAAALNDHNAWWPVMPEIAHYLQKVSYLLRQGRPAIDVALLLPTDDAWASFTLGKDSVSESMEGLLGPNVIPEILRAGLNFDFVDAEAIEKLGIPYPVLILPRIERLPLSTYQKIEQYAEKGGLVIATRALPSMAPGLLQEKTDTPRVRAISQKLFRESGARGYFLPHDAGLSAFLHQHFTADVSTSPKAADLGFVHRKMPFADVYFLANTSNRPLSTTAVFRATSRHSEWWDPFSGEISSASSSPSIELHLQPYESRVLVFGDQNEVLQPPSNARSGERNGGSATIDLGGGWTVTFPRISRTIQMQELRSWTDDEETRFYSGEAVYEKDFTVSNNWLGSRTYLDFGPGTIVEPPTNGVTHFRALLESPVREVAQVFINGQEEGSIWKPPYELEVTASIRIGQNHLKIILYNLAINALAGRVLPDYRLLNSLYGQRFKPQGMENVEPLPSGLLTAPRLVIVGAE